MSNIVIPQFRVLLCTYEVFCVAHVQRASYVGNTVHVSYGWEPVVWVRWIPNVLYLHTCTVSMKAVLAVHMETLQKHLKSLKRCCNIGQLVGLGCPWQSHKFPILPGQTSMLKRAHGRKQAYGSHKARICFSYWMMMPLGGTVQTKLCQMQLRWRIKLVTEKCRLCRLKRIPVRSKVAYQSTD